MIKFSIGADSSAKVVLKTKKYLKKEDLLWSNMVSTTIH